MDETFQTYLNRAVRLILPETQQSQVQHIQESPKFDRDPVTGYRPRPFPGFTVITPPGQEDQENAAFYQQLAQYQQQIISQIGDNYLIALPPDSFHLTLADLIWDNAYTDAVTQRPDFDHQLRVSLAETFRECHPLTHGKSIPFQVLGLMVMTRALGVCLAPTNEDGYDRILKLRRAIYQNPAVIGLGIEQQYYFTPHITLGYFGNVPTPEEQAGFGDRLSRLNQYWLETEPQTFEVKRAEVRQFTDMTCYARQPDWPALEF